jgi:hypothetical protein
MGQAKKRGSYEVRRAEAVERRLCAENEARERRQKALEEKRAAEQARWESLSPEEQEKEKQEQEQERRRRRNFPAMFLLPFCLGLGFR